MKEAKECEYGENRAAKLLLSKICAWKIKENISRLRLDVKRELDEAVCTHQDWLEAIEATNKLKFERMKVLNRVNRAIKVSHEKLKESLVDIGVHDALAKFLAHDIGLAKHANLEDHLGLWSSFMFVVICLGFLSVFWLKLLSQPSFTVHLITSCSLIVHGQLHTHLASNVMRLRTRFCLASGHLPRLLLIVVCFSDGTPQDSEHADQRNFQTPGFVDDTSHWSKVLQLFFSSESEMQKLQKKTHNIASTAPEDDITGNTSTLVKPADSCAAWPKSAWDKNAFPLGCFSVLFDSHYGQVLRETSGPGGHAVFAT